MDYKARIEKAIEKHKSLFINAQNLKSFEKIDKQFCIIDVLENLLKED